MAYLTRSIRYSTSEFEHASFARQGLYLVILDMCALPGLKMDPASSCQRLILPMDEAGVERALQQLLSLGFLRRRDDGRVERINEQIQRNGS